MACSQFIDAIVCAAASTGTRWTISPSRSRSVRCLVSPQRLSLGQSTPTQSRISPRSSLTRNREALERCWKSTRLAIARSWNSRIRSSDSLLSVLVPPAGHRWTSLRTARWSLYERSGEISLRCFLIHLCSLVGTSATPPAGRIIRTLRRGRGHKYDHCAITLLCVCVLTMIVNKSCSMRLCQNLTVTAAVLPLKQLRGPLAQQRAEELLKTRQRIRCVRGPLWEISGGGNRRPAEAERE